jgi:hypothetical protein
MKKIFRYFLASSRKSRRRAVGAAIWLLRLIRDVESDEMWRNSDLLDSIVADVSHREYLAVEDDYLDSESSLVFLESAIDDLDFAY